MLFNKKLSDFGRPFEETHFYEEFQEVLREFHKLGIDVNPRLWFSTEWFCPDGVEGIGVPFYLKSLALMKKIKNMGGRIEGQTRTERKKLYRHEIAHVVDNVYDLRRFRKRAEIFGKSSNKYPTYFIPNVDDRRNLKHIDSYYWQSHPCEDWAETFSVVVENWDKLNSKRFSSDKKINYIIGIIKNFHLLKKKSIPRNEVESIKFDERSVETFILESLESNGALIFPKGDKYSKKGGVTLCLEEIKRLKSESAYPWVFDNLIQVVNYRKSCLGRKTMLSKRHWKGLLSSDLDVPKELGLNKVFM